MIPRVLTIAGSDSGGGAGIQADIKTFTVHGVFGASAITAVTAQNTIGVMGMLALPPELVRLQIDAVLDDIGADAVKTGMLANTEIVRAVAAALRAHEVRRLVVDPVMVAQSGQPLLTGADAMAVLVAELLPQAMIATPNIPEAEALIGRPIRSLDDMRQAAVAICGLGARSCLLKGGHMERAASVDIFYDGRELHELHAERLATEHTHGTGCQLSAAIAANLALGLELHAAVIKAKEFITAAIASGLALGTGHGPANPMALKRGD